jgi:putative colanic acid biosynthesis acetyltransferase WcaF
MFDLRLFKKRKLSKLHFLKIALWFFINNLIICSFIPFSKIRVFLLKLFGAKVGNNVIIHPYVNIKYPWKLEIGNNCWIGYRVWIDNIAAVKIGNNCCISQDVYFCTGNHNFKKKEFDLLSEEIIVEDNSWIAAKTIIAPGVCVKKNSIIKLGSIIFKKN